MIVTEDLVLGFILGTSLAILSLSLLSYRRSGLKGLRVLTMGLVVQIALTMLLLAIDLWTDWLAQGDLWAAIFFDVIVLLAVLAVGMWAGRTHERSA
jgi:hypothetical protein